MLLHSFRSCGCYVFEDTHFFKYYSRSIGMTASSSCNYTYVNRSLLQILSSKSLELYLFLFLSLSFIIIHFLSLPMTIFYTRIFSFTRQSNMKFLQVHVHFKDTEIRLNEFIFLLGHHFSIYKQYCYLVYISLLR